MARSTPRVLGPPSGWVDGYLIDIVRGQLLIEVQTGNVSSIKSKVRDLLRSNVVRICRQSFSESYGRTRKQTNKRTQSLLN